MASLKTSIILAVLLAVPSARAQEDDETRAGLSREMKVAVRFYEKGDDMQAMDRFMEILTTGESSERSMANEYINLITHRMNSSASPVTGPAPAKPSRPASEAVSPRAAPKIPVAQPAPVLEPAPRQARPAARPSRGEEMPAADKSVMRKEIEARLRAAQEKSLADLKEIEGVRVTLSEKGDPEAIGIPAELLFQSGIAFQRGASRLLDPLTRLVFALGSAQALIMPEGTPMGDAKVLDMRRAMGISAHLYQAGVAPARVRVNLLNSHGAIPKALADFKGVVIVFIYEQTLALSVESAVGDELGPPISLGVYPGQIRPARNQGAIIEFSVSDPPAGLVSWKFSLLQPSKDGAELVALQEVVGGGPAFHRIFWNGRQNYFGQTLPAGRYECVLSALDAKNRRRTLRRWIQVQGENDAGERLLGEEVEPRKSPAATVAAPSADLPGALDAPLVRRVKPGAAGKRKPVPRLARGAKTSELQAGAAEPGRYELSFNKNTHELTADSQKSLARVAEALSPASLRETLKVVGHAAAEEGDGAALADRRAKMVAGLLINRYQVEPKKIQVSSSASGQGAKVELVLARND